MFPAKRFKNKHILVGITGGIAAYKAVELIRYLVTQQAEVRVVMTAAAEQFITRLTLETLSQNPVVSQMFPQQHFGGTHHIHLADWAEAAVIVPATYNFIGKYCAGIADDALSTIAAALHCPIVIAPAMNVHMWENPVLQRNLKDLQETGISVCPPEEGFLAEGYSGRGRLARLESLIQYLYRALHPYPQSLQGKKVLITAGRTEEPLDPVRFLTNRSSGKMGFALAWEAFARGAEVVLIHGPGHLQLPAEIKTHAVRKAEEMFNAVQQYLPDSDIFVSTAAVADYTPVNYEEHKIKKQDQGISLELKRTTDILSYTAQHKKTNQKRVGFAVETRRGEENARHKMDTKNLDMVVLNNPLEAGAGFETDTNRTILLGRDGRKRELPLLPKLDNAFQIFEFLINEKSSSVK
ncbi:MAG: bifunctional phosphopantothenoylcysteine decarboxylase/phosphopantothenate--cysteine ligase CoaBC [Calditrichia bacterium]